MEIADVMGQQKSNKSGNALVKARPRLVVLAGPNGAGKSSSASLILHGPLEVDEFINADTIAQGLSGFAPERMALAAGRIMLARLKELAENRVSFAFETTLASRTFAPWISQLRTQGFEFHLVFLWLPSADAAVARVAERVRSGGHNVPEDTIRRRYRMGVRNFFSLYQPLAKTWQVIDNSNETAKIIAAGSGRKAETISDADLWERVQRHDET